jgi:hypothetical protein
MLLELYHNTGLCAIKKSGFSLPQTGKKTNRTQKNIYVSKGKKHCAATKSKRSENPLF